MTYDDWRYLYCTYSNIEGAEEEEDLEECPFNPPTALWYQEWWLGRGNEMPDEYWQAPIDYYQPGTMDGVYFHSYKIPSNFNYYKDGA